MNLSEFKAWFEGFTEDMEGPPNKKQWARVQEKIEKIKDAPPVTQHVFHDYYYRPWRRWYEVPYVWPTYTSTLQTPTAGDGTNNQQSGLSALAAIPQNSAVASNAMPAEFDSGRAFRELGRAEARSMTKAY
jgi:hypothetical protein